MGMKQTTDNTAF